MEVCGRMRCANPRSALVTPSLIHNSAFSHYDSSDATLLNRPRPSCVFFRMRCSLKKCKNLGPDDNLPSNLGRGFPLADAGSRIPPSLPEMTPHARQCAFCAYRKALRSISPIRSPPRLLTRHSRSHARTAADVRCLTPRPRRSLGSRSPPPPRASPAPNAASSAPRTSRVAPAAPPTPSPWPPRPRRRRRTCS